MTRAFKMKWKAFFTNFKRLLLKHIKQISLEGESPNLRIQCTAKLKYQRIAILRSNMVSLNFCKFGATYDNTIS